MATANARLREFACVISLKDMGTDLIRKYYMPLVRTFCEDNNADSYAYILHDNDFAIVDGEEVRKTPHIHLIATFPSCKRSTRLTTWVNKIASTLGISPLAVSLDALSSFDGAFQYLIHKNDLDKFQYSKDDIVSSFSSSEVDTILNREVKSFTIDFLFEQIDRSNTLSDLVKNIGLKMYVAYRNVIKDLFLDRKNLQYSVKAEKDE